MALSSINHFVRIDNEQDAEAFVNALEESARLTALTADEDLSGRKYRFVTDPDEIRAAVEGWRKHHREQRSEQV